MPAPAHDDAKREYVKHMTEKQMLKKQVKFEMLL
jgi:hypothetical protein